MAERRVGRAEIDQTTFFVRIAAIATRCRHLAKSLPQFERDTIGRQLVRASDSVGANLVEGEGRFGEADTLHFFVIARASAREARYWLNLASERGLINSDDATELLAGLDRGSRELNALITYRCNHMLGRVVREDVQSYDCGVGGPDEETTAHERLPRP